jgi:hypothetical protein
MSAAVTDLRDFVSVLERAVPWACIHQPTRQSTLARRQRCRRTGRWCGSWSERRVVQRSNSANDESVGFYRDAYGARREHTATVRALGNRVHRSG